MSNVAPMTAAEYRVRFSNTIANGWDGAPAILAALEEREALLGKLARATRALTRIGYTDCGGEEWKPPLGDRSDASVGALVRRIGELQPSAYLTWAGHPMCYYVKHPSVLQSALDSLLPKEPEPKWSGLAPSGGRYRVRGGLLYADDGIEMGQVDRVGVEDIPFVAALLEASRGN